jgi:O-antigen/teichoic acid export membrane protein
VAEIESSAPGPVTSHADRLARGALLQQGAQIARLVGGLAVVTILVRSLPADEYGVYAVLLSFVTYVQFIKASVMNAAVVGIAESDTGSDRLDIIISTGFAIYAVSVPWLPAAWRSWGCSSFPSSTSRKTSRARLRPRLSGSR